MNLQILQQEKSYVIDSESQKLFVQKLNQILNRFIRIKPL